MRFDFSAFSHIILTVENQQKLLVRSPETENFATKEVAFEFTPTSVFRNPEFGRSQRFVIVYFTSMLSKPIIANYRI